VTTLFQWAVGWCLLSLLFVVLFGALMARSDDEDEDSQ